MHLSERENEDLVHILIISWMSDCHFNLNVAAKHKLTPVARCYHEITNICAKLKARPKRKKTFEKSKENKACKNCNITEYFQWD